MLGMNLTGDDRGMTGIGVLILFIALVLVAAIASGLILDTAGFLQNTAQDTGEQSTSEVSDRLTVLSASGDIVQTAEMEELDANDPISVADDGAATDDVVTVDGIGDEYTIEYVHLTNIDTDTDTIDVGLDLNDDGATTEDVSGVDVANEDSVVVEFDSVVTDDGDVNIEVSDVGTDEFFDAEASVVVENGEETNVVEQLGLTVYRSPGAGDIDLQHATIEKFSPSGTAFLIHEDEYADLTEEELREDFSDNLGTFSVEAVKDDDGSIPVLNSRDDRASILVGLYAFPPADDEPRAMQTLEEGDSATLRITTPSGATTTEIVNVPESLAGYEGSTVLL